jgi:hypothetical protein
MTTAKSTFPAPGNYYRHYKHDPNGEFNNYVYRVLGLGNHTEIKDLGDSAMVIYRPMYSSAFVYKAGKQYDVRPLKMFVEHVENGGCIQPRFVRIENSDVIKKLDALYLEMY